MIFCITPVKKWLVHAGLLSFLVSGSGLSLSAKQSAKIPNPASVNCVKKGGHLKISKKPDGGEYGICMFEDDRMCEEWALFNGNCPAGGVRTSGFVTSAGLYCAITGGSYRITANSGRADEKGKCIFKSGKVCNAESYYLGQCTPQR